MLAHVCSISRSRLVHSIDPVANKWYFNCDQVIIEMCSVECNIIDFTNIKRYKMSLLPCDLSRHTRL